MNELTFKLYSPLTADYLSDESVLWRDEDTVELHGYELTDYADAISQQIEREGEHLEQYLDAESEPYLTDHVKSIRISVEERGGELCGCATVVVDGDLTEHGWNELQEYLSGQYSDGWGEGFEQRIIQVEDGILNVHFWQPKQFDFTVEQVADAPQMEPTGRDAPSAPGMAQPQKPVEPSQPAKKYEITDMAHPVYPELHRIRALQRVSETVGPGTLGGYVQSEENLTQENDGAWIYGDAICCESAIVTTGAFLTGQARVSGSALISNEAEVGGQGRVRDRAVVSGGTVQEGAVVCGDAVIRKNQITGSVPFVEGHATVMGTVAGAVYLAADAFILPGNTVDNPTNNVLAINGTHVRLYSIAQIKPPKAPER